MLASGARGQAGNGYAGRRARGCPGSGGRAVRVTGVRTHGGPGASSPSSTRWPHNRLAAPSTDHGMPSAIAARDARRSSARAVARISASPSSNRRSRDALGTIYEARQRDARREDTGDGQPASPLVSDGEPVALGIAHGDATMPMAPHSGRSTTPSRSLEWPSTPRTHAASRRLRGGGAGALRCRVGRGSLDVARRTVAVGVDGVDHGRARPGAPTPHRRVNGSTDCSR